jgi:hypothetical protein
MQRSGSSKDTFYDLSPVPPPPEGVALPEQMAKDFFLHLDTMGKRPGLDAATMGEGLSSFAPAWHNAGPARRAVRMETHVISPDDCALLARDAASDAVVRDLSFFQNALSAVASGLYYLTAAVAPALAADAYTYDTARHLWAAMFELHGMMQLRMRQRLELALFGTPIDALPLHTWPAPYKPTPMIPVRERKELRAPRQPAPRHRRRGNGAAAAATADAPAASPAPAETKGFRKSGSKSGTGIKAPYGARAKHK